MWNLKMRDVKEDSGLALEKFVVTDRKKRKKSDGLLFLLKQSI